MINIKGVIFSFFSAPEICEDVEIVLKSRTSFKINYLFLLVSVTAPSGDDFAALE